MWWKFVITSSPSSIFWPRLLTYVALCQETCCCLLAWCSLSPSRAKLVWSQSQYQSFNKFWESSLLRLLLITYYLLPAWWTFQVIYVKESSGLDQYIRLFNLEEYIHHKKKTLTPLGRQSRKSKHGWKKACKKGCRSRKKVREERCTGRKIHFSHYFLQSTMCYLLLNLQIRKHA